MKWRAFFLEYLRNLVLTLVISGAVLGALGYSWAGVEGLKNSLSWALAITLFSAPLSALVAASAFDAAHAHATSPQRPSSTPAGPGRTRSRHR